MTRVELVAAYEAGTPVPQLAAVTGLSESTVLRRLRGGGVAMRSPGGHVGVRRRASRKQVQR